MYIIQLTRTFCDCYLIIYVDYVDQFSHLSKNSLLLCFCGFLWDALWNNFFLCISLLSRLNLLEAPLRASGQNCGRVQYFERYHYYCDQCKYHEEIPSNTAEDVQYC